MDLFGQCLVLLRCDGCLVLFFEASEGVRLGFQVFFGVYQEDGNVGVVVVYFWMLFVSYIFIGGRIGNGEIDDKDVGLRVGECAEAVVFFLVRCVLQVQVYCAFVYCILGVVIVEYCGDVFFGEGISRVVDEQVRFVYSFIVYYYIFDVLYRGCSCCSGGNVFFLFRVFLDVVIYGKMRGIFVVREVFIYGEERMGVY